MRLIDADALIEEFEEYEDYVRENSDCFVSASETSEVIDYMKELAMRMPTVEEEPVVHGEWIDDTACLDSMRQYKCSECGKRPILGSNWVSMLTNYCPNCGAKMDGGVSE